ncbi:MAG: TetR/AcrR family transcriptional regulator [Lachnospiraceae bacterium]
MPLEEASINRIVHDADISRGSFYTSFEDKQDLLKWLIYAQAEKHFKDYIERLQENGGDLWDMLENVFDPRTGSYGAGRSDQYFSESDEEAQSSWIFSGVIRSMTRRYAGRIRAL